MICVVDGKVGQVVVCFRLLGFCCFSDGMDLLFFGCCFSDGMDLLFFGCCLTYPDLTNNLI